MKIINRSLLTSLALSLSSLAFAQQPVWNTVVKNPVSFARYAVPLDGGGTLVFLSASNFVRLDGQGNTVTQGQVALTFNVMNAISDGAGGAYLVGIEAQGAIGGPTLGGLDAVVTRVNANGQEIWSKRIGGSETDIGRGILLDGGELVIAGSTASPDFGVPSGSFYFSDGFLARLDPTDGSVLWVTRDNTGLERTSYWDVVRTLQGDWLLTGTTEDYLGCISPVIARYTSGGSLLSLENQFFYYSFGDIAVNGSGYVAVVNPHSGKVNCVGFDASGIAQFHVDLHSSNDSTAFSVVSVSPDLFVMGGWAIEQTSQGPVEVRSLRAFDSAGTVLWDLQIPDPTGANGHVHDLAVDRDGGLFACGRTSFDPSMPGGPKDAWVGYIAIDRLGVPGCAAQPNSTGVAASTLAVGSDVRADNRVILGTSSLPIGQFGFYLASTTSGLVSGPGGSQGDLCLGGSIGSFNRAGEVQLSGSDGLFSLVLDLRDIPTPSGSVSATAGQTWNFQSWYRDRNPGATSNFSSSVLVTLN